MTANPQASPPIEVLPRDIEPYRHGNTGVDFVWRFDSGRPGPHVAVAGLTHGSEICGMTAVTWLLDRAVRPARGTLTLWLANVEAYRRFDAARAATDPSANRFVARDLNRCWSDAVLDGPEDDVELARARELRPFVAAADELLDIHSTSFSTRPFFAFRDLPRVRALVDAIGRPGSQLLLTGGDHSGQPMIESGRFSDPAGTARALAIECGTHFSRAAGDEAIAVSLAFLDAVGMLEADFVRHHVGPRPAEPPKRYVVHKVYRATSDDARFVRPFAGFEELPSGAPILVDDGREFVAPFDRCVVLMPRPTVKRGGELVTLARIVD